MKCILFSLAVVGSSAVAPKAQVQKALEVGGSAVQVHNQVPKAVAVNSSAVAPKAKVNSSVVAPKAQVNSSVVAPPKAHKASLIDPNLDPKSDKKFFGKDYPYDVSHRTNIDVPYPYPVVQASAAYDKDYTKDENSNRKDGTNWELQLKHAKQVSDAAAEVERLQAKLAKEKKDVSDAAEKEPKAPMPTKVDLAAKDVEAGVTHLEGCKEELEAAKKRLQSLQDSALAAEKAVKDATAEDEKAVKDEAAAEAKATSLSAVIEEYKGAHEKADGHLAEEKSKLDAVREQEKGFEERLRNFRGGPTTTTQAPPPPAPRSGAASVSVLAGGALAAVVTAVNCL